MRSYESVVIIDSQLEDEPIEKEINRIEQLIVAQKGEMVNIERWGRRKLSYGMKGRQQGFYTLIRFNSEVSGLREMNRVLKLNERILRHMTTQVKKHDLPDAEKTEVTGEATAKAGE